jgi:Protein of unknown function (DUF3309)
MVFMDGSARFFPEETIPQKPLFRILFAGTAGTALPPGCSRVIAQEKDFKMLGTILIVVLLLLLLGAWPSWPHSRGWGYYPSGTLGLVLVIVLVLALVGRI